MAAYSGRRRLHLLGMVGLAVATLAACGSESVDVSDGAGGGIEHPTAPDQPIIRLTNGGGFVPRGADFVAPPELVIEGDGTVFRPGPQITIYPGPLLPALTTAPLDQEGIQAVLEAARAGRAAGPSARVRARLRARRRWPTPRPRCWRSHANGQTYRHEAYALGFTPSGQESTTAAPGPQRLRDAAEGPALHWSASTWARTRSTRRSASASSPRRPRRRSWRPPRTRSRPTVVPWPDAAGSLADASSCTEIPASSVGSTFADANQLTRFSQAGVTYTVFVRVLLPDETCASVSGSI